MKEKRSRRTIVEFLVNLFRFDRRIKTISDRTDTQFVGHRTDNDMVAAYGTCYLNDFRFFTMLHHDSWDLMRWETIGNAVLAHRTWRNWPYEQRIRIEVDGRSVHSDSVTVDQVEHQFDFRRTAVSADPVKLERVDLMISPRQWMTALRLTNRGSSQTGIVVTLEWRVKDGARLSVRPRPDNSQQGFAYSVEGGPPILVSVGQIGEWEARDDVSVHHCWTCVIGPGESETLEFDVHVGWAVLLEYRDSGPGEIATDSQAAIDRRADRDGFGRLTASWRENLSLRRWDDIQELCSMRRHYLHDRMPRLTGFPPVWEGMWLYTFDLIRSGLYPAQGNFKDVWKVESLDVYREPFYWDGPASVHTFCNWDADISARTLKTFLGATKENGELCVSANPYRSFANPTPQLANITMALWDCYQITRDKEMLASCYPLVVKHVRWLETERNRSIDGPLMDVGYNIDYGPKELYATPTIWPDVQFFLVDRYQRLAQVAHVINRPEAEIAEWENRAAQLTDAIRENMWDDENGTFWCVADSLEFKHVPSPIEFHGMVAGVPTQEHARRLLVRLKDPNKYAPSDAYPYGLPSAPFDSPYFVVADSWSGTIWPVQTYYTVRGLVNYGFQNEAADLSLNLYGMMARDYGESGSIWEQYDPRNGTNLSNGFEGNNTPEVGRGYFTSGITTSVVDMMLRGFFGFERTDHLNEFYLTPTQLTGTCQGIKNLVLSGETRLSILLKKKGSKFVCKIVVSGLPPGAWIVAVHKLDPSNDTRELVHRTRLDSHGKAVVRLDRSEGFRYLWKIDKLDGV